MIERKIRTAMQESPPAVEDLQQLHTCQILSGQNGPGVVNAIGIRTEGGGEKDAGDRPIDYHRNLRGNGTAPAVREREGVRRGGGG